MEEIKKEKSEFIKTRLPNINVGERFPRAEIKGSIRIVFSKNLLGTKPIFFIYQSFLRTFLYCNEEFKNSVEAQKIKTIVFHPIEELIKYLDYTYSLELSDTEFIIE